MLHFCAVLDDVEAQKDFRPYLVGDVLMERFVKWADHDVKRGRLRTALQAHLAED